MYLLFIQEWLQVLFKVKSFYLPKNHPRRQLLKPRNKDKVKTTDLSHSNIFLSLSDVFFPMFQGDQKKKMVNSERMQHTDLLSSLFTLSRYFPASLVSLLLLSEFQRINFYPH